MRLPPASRERKEKKLKVVCFVFIHFSGVWPLPAMLLNTPPPARAVGFPAARYPTVIHPSATLPPMSDAARTPPDARRGGCEY